MIIFGIKTNLKMKNTRYAKINISAKNLPAILYVEQAAMLLGLKPHDFPIIDHIVKPLGNPAKNAPKMYCKVEILKIANDPDLLNKIVIAKQKYWREKSKRRRQS